VVSQHGRFVLAPAPGCGKQRVPDLRIIYNSAEFVEAQVCQRSVVRSTFVGFSGRR
jgi:hypothetical protein